MLAISLSRPNMRVLLLISPLFAAPHGLASPLSERADYVVLDTADDGMRFEGTLQFFDGQVYRLITGIGPVVVPAQFVRCSGPGCPRGAVLRLSGARTLGAELVPSLLDAYSMARDADVSFGGAAENGARQITLTHYAGAPLAEVALRSEGSSTGLQDLNAGRAEIALTTRPAPQAPSGPVETVIALDGLLVVTAPGNPVRSLTAVQIAGIFSGQINNWLALGGPDAPIALYGRAADTGTGSIFAELVLHPAESSVARALRVLDSDAAVSDAVRADPLGIGFTSFSNERGARAVAIRGPCGIQTPANAFNIKTEEYPLTRRLYAYRQAADTPDLARDFLEFVASDAAQAVVARAGFVDQGISTQSVDDMGLRMVASVLPSEAEAELAALRGMMAELVTAERLSLTFRFENGSSQLDSRATGDLARLAELIRAGFFRNREVLLLGFTDAVGAAEINAGLSLIRAKETEAALRTLLPTNPLTRITPIGYGEMSPLGCNDTAQGRRINRRVEVWIRDLAE